MNISVLCPFCKSTQYNIMCDPGLVLELLTSYNYFC